MTRALALLLGVGRVAIGAVLVAEPRLVTARWLGPQEAGRRKNQVLARGLGARDVALGAGLVQALVREDASVVPWLVAGAAADAGDLAGTLLAGDALPPAGRTATLALAGGAAVVAAGLVVAWER
jgi:hypothetical protein